VAEGAPLERE